MQERQEKLMRICWKKQPGQRLANRPERIFAQGRVTNPVRPKVREMVSRNASEGIQPRNSIFACGQGFCILEASNEARIIGERVDTCTGSKSATVHRVLIGTWESPAVLEGSVRQAAEARRMYGGRAVGLTHSRGVAGVMSGAGRSPLEGVSDKTQGLEEASAIH